MSTQALPRLLDRRAIAEELGVKLASAETLMRKTPKVHIGRRVFVREDDLRQTLSTLRRSA